MPEAELEPIEGESRVGKTGRVLISFVSPEALTDYWWLKDDTGEILRWGVEYLGKEF